MRLFIAAELPQPLRDALAETSADLRACVHGRYVGSDSFHVTLAFLGEVPAARVTALEGVLDRACAGQGPIALELGELGRFGKRSKATLWQGFRDETALASLARAVRHELADQGFSFDDKAFRGHVTLMRAADLTEGALPLAHVARAHVDTVTLFRSDLSGARPVYEPLYQVRLD